MTSTTQAPHSTDFRGGHERRRLSACRDLGNALSRLLVERPELAEIARLVVALLRAPLGAQGARVVIGRAMIGVSALNLTDRARLVSVTDSLNREHGPDPDGDSCEVAAIALGPEGAPLGSLAVCLAAPAPRARVMSCLQELSWPMAIYAAGIITHTPALSPVDLSSPTPGPVADALSPRQRDVLAGLARGLTMRQIAVRLGFSDSTIRAESLAVYRYFGVHGRNEAVRAAHAAGLLDTPPPGCEETLIRGPQERRATISISTRAPRGSPVTATVVRAGSGSSK